MTSPHGTARDARAQAHAEKAYRKAQRPFYAKKRFIIPAVLAVIVIVGALTFFPALSLGPVVEHLLMNAGHLFGRSSHVCEGDLSCFCRSTSYLRFDMSFATRRWRLAGLPQSLSSL